MDTFAPVKGCQNPTGSKRVDCCGLVIACSYDLIAFKCLMRVATDWQGGYQPNFNAVLKLLTVTGMEMRL